MTEPQTEAGRALLTNLRMVGPSNVNEAARLRSTVKVGILNIEAEAAAQARHAALAEVRREVEPEWVARQFHEAYERLAPSFGYETRKASAVPWSDVPEPNHSLMVAVASEVLSAILDAAETP